MAIRFSRHTLGARDFYGEQIGDSVTVADGAASSALTSGGLYRIAATTNSLVRVGSGLTNGSGGFYMAAGTVETVRVPAGFVIGCSAG